MSTFINFISENIIWLALTAVTCGILMVVMGIQWEKSGKTEALRKAWLINASKLFATLFGLSITVFALALIVRLIRVIVKT